MTYRITRLLDELEHHGILGQKWGIRRYQNPDGSLTAEGKKRYSDTFKDPKANAKRTKKLALGTLATTAAADAAIGAAARLYNASAYGPISKGIAVAESAAKGARIGSNAGHLAGMISGKSGIGETLMGAKTAVQVASVGAKVTSNLLFKYGGISADTFITVSNIAVGASLVGTVLTGASLGVTAYSVGRKLYKNYQSKHSSDKKVNK